MIIKCKICGELKEKYTSSYCEVCGKKYNREYYQKNKEEASKKQIEYYNNNWEKCNESNKKYYKKHQEKIKKYFAEYVKKNKEKIYKNKKYILGGMSDMKIRKVNKKLTKELMEAEGYEIVVNNTKIKLLGFHKILNDEGKIAFIFKFKNKAKIIMYHNISLEGTELSRIMGILIDNKGDFNIVEAKDVFSSAVKEHPEI